MNNQRIKWHFVKSGSKSNPALLFLHGFLGSAADWQDITDALSSDFHCLCVDLPGHGKTVAAESDYEMPNCAANIVALLNELQMERCHVAGYSMGGRLALYLAVHHGDRFNRFVIESASPGLRTETERLQRIEHDRKLADKISTTPLDNFLSEWYNQPLFATIDQSSPAFRKSLKSRASNDPSGLSRSLEKMGTGAQPSLWSDLDRVKSDLLLIVGQHDTKFNKIATEVAASCPSARLTVVPGTGHNVHLENPKEYLKQVRLFLQS